MYIYAACRFQIYHFVIFVNDALRKLFAGHAHLVKSEEEVYPFAAIATESTISRSNHNYLFDDLVRTNGCSNRLRRSLNKKSKRNEKETVSSSGFVCFC